MGKIEKACVTIGAIVCILLGASKGTSGPGLLVLGAIGGGVGAVIGSFIGALKR